MRDFGSCIKFMVFFKCAESESSGFIPVNCNISSIL